MSLNLDEILLNETFVQFLLQLLYACSVLDSIQPGYICIGYIKRYLTLSPNIFLSNMSYDQSLLEICNMQYAVFVFNHILTYVIHICIPLQFYFNSSAFFIIIMFWKMVKCIVIKRYILLFWLTLYWRD